MNIVSPSDYIDALSGISEYVAVKRFRIKDKSNTVMSFSPVQQEIIEEIKQHTGLNLLSATNDELQEIEQEINHKLTSTAERIISYPVDDELQLIEDAVEMNVGDFKKIKVTVGDHIKDFVRSFDLSIPEIVSIINTPHQVFCVNPIIGEYPKEYLVISKTLYKRHAANAFIHVTQRDSEFAMIQTFLISRNEITEGFNPVRLFLNMLDWFGTLLEINNKKRKFFRAENVATTDATKIFTYHGHNPKDKIIICTTLKIGYVSTSTCFTYGFNKSRYLADLKNGAI